VQPIGDGGSRDHETKLASEVSGRHKAGEREDGGLVTATRAGYHL
jgi:hypothetical protein